jgi:outer membrane lipoprotein SlyB
VIAATEVVMRIALNILPALIVLAPAILCAGCASSLSGGAYSRGEVGQEQSVELGVVESVREVRIEGTKSNVGTLAGAGVGGIAGSTLGQGKGSTVTSILGAVAGGVAGSAAEEGITRQKGLEITVKLDSGRTVAVVQAADQPFAKGDRVRLVGSRARTRVEHY